MPKPKILVIDNSRGSHKTISVLMGCYFNITGIRYREDALNILEEEGETFKLILLDWQSIGGTQLFGYILANLYTTPLVVTSSSIKAKKEALDFLPQELHNYFGFIQKPCERQKMITAIKTAKIQAEARKEKPKPQVYLDEDLCLHAIGKPAYQDADGLKIYAYHGVILPEKYGKLTPEQWQAEWILTEPNAEIRRVLIQGIGEDKVAEELQEKKLSSWREYTLVSTYKTDEIEPIYMLKMTCPSTGHIHALRVPPNIESAREAVSWVNWGIDPEQFLIET